MGLFKRLKSRKNREQAIDEIAQFLLKEQEEADAAEAKRLGISLEEYKRRMQLQQEQSDQ